jgi:23S rRNA pseudouridine1911/1915/1917 synthase
MDSFEVGTNTKPTRIDKYLTTVLEESRATIQMMIKEGYILVNEEEVKANYTIKVGDVIDIYEVPETTIDVIPENIPLDIVYQDDDVIVIDKTNGMVVHPGAGNPSGTLVNALLYHVPDFQAIKGEIRPGIVHRIDKETTGLLVVAKNPNALTALSNQMKDKTASRIYLALVEGVIPHNLGKIDAPIGRDPKYRQRMAVVEGGKPAVTHFQVIKRFTDNTLIECELETGRTHQIRVHLNYIHYPIVGDPKYGRKKTDTTHGQFLHATTLRFIHPTTGQEMEFHSDLPDYFKDYIEELT